MLKIVKNNTGDFHVTLYLKILMLQIPVLFLAATIVVPFANSSLSVSVFTRSNVNSPTFILIFVGYFYRIQIQYQLY